MTGSNPPAVTSAHSATESTEWPNLTQTDKMEMIGVPLALLVAIIIWLNVLWPPPAKQPSRQKVADSEAQAEAMEGKIKGLPKIQAVKVHEAGEAAGDYKGDWRESFDLTFLIFMIIMGICLTGVTFVYEPELLANPVFWKSSLVKLSIICFVSIVGGILCRCYCAVDEDGYILTSKASWFKVNYTRKFQHFAAYAIPLLVKTDIPGYATLHLVWGDFFTLIGFLVLIKPLRERFLPFMLMFNSLDRPEDRPNCIKWIIAGNILPGLAMIIFWRWMYARFGPQQQGLAMIFVLVAGVGDGFAEPVGIYFGKHKYKTRSCTSNTLYQRSFEGSACVFLSTYIWIDWFYASFLSRQQFWIVMVVLPITMAIAEATSPHTMDTPLLMGLGGLIIYAVLRWC